MAELKDSELDGIVGGVELRAEPHKSLEKCGKYAAREGKENVAQGCGTCIHGIRGRNDMYVCGF